VTKQVRIAVGLILILIEVKSCVLPSDQLFTADNADQQLGMNIVSVIIVAVGCWLIYSGFRMKEKNPNDPQQS
jgi:putative Mn2+ efflux pump MntP